MTEKQLDILRHALGWPKCYRNHFVTGEGSDDFADCETLVEEGAMKRTARDWIDGYIYIVTEAGKSMLCVDWPKQ